MSLESIYRVVSSALKSASEVSSGTAEEKATLEVLRGLSGMLEARVQLHKHATPATLTAEAHAAGKAPPAAGAPRQTKPVATPAGFQKQRPASDAGDSYDLK